jgi:hypothetical protein
VSQHRKPAFAWSYKSGTEFTPISANPANPTNLEFDYSANPKPEKSSKKNALSLSKKTKSDLSANLTNNNLSANLKKNTSANMKKNTSANLKNLNDISAKLNVGDDTESMEEITPRKGKREREREL